MRVALKLCGSLGVARDCLGYAEGLQLRAPADTPAHPLAARLKPPTVGSYWVHFQPPTVTGYIFNRQLLAVTGYIFNRQLWAVTGYIFNRQLLAVTGYIFNRQLLAVTGYIFNRQLWAVAGYNFQVRQAARVRTSRPPRAEGCRPPCIVSSITLRLSFRRIAALHVHSPTDPSSRRQVRSSR